ncbi:MAG: type I restriction enzyme HsdR N-terminal domain-containing protein [Thermodesulfobacteriota bacterium]|nr:type I restriction enzyme HsdR N-terminal domain-containing protein [Thermodesulfobacteriota bacterium]
MLASVFGFYKYTEITSEQSIKSTFCDLAVKLDGKIKYLIEVKAIGLNLKENHLHQAINYGATHGIQWVVLTNGIDWEIYKIKFEKPLDYDLVCSFNFIELNPKKQDNQSKVFLLCKEGIIKSAMEEFHEHIQIVNRFMLGAIMLSNPVVSTIRRELKKISGGVKVTEEEIESILSSEVLKRDIVQGEQAEKTMKHVKKEFKKQTQRKVTKKIVENNTQNETDSE